MTQSKNLYLKFLILIMLIAGCGQQQGAKQTSRVINEIKIEEEIFYLIFPRSFYDSNGDRIGDLNGVTQQLDYIQSLGVTSIIMTPLYPSPYYHNYFTHDFYGIDPEFGTMDDYLNMVKEIHRRGMKFYMDTELQYVPREHPWVKESYKNPESKYSKYVLYKDSLNAELEGMLSFDLKGLKSYDGYYTDITTVNLYNPEVLQYITNYYQFWIDPNTDGSFDDGVDGFRLDSFKDNMLENGSNKDIFTNLAEDFWKPLIDQCKRINPDVTFIAEQASWNDDDAHKWMKKSGVEIAYSFGLHFNLTNPNILKEYFIWSENELPEGKKMFAFLDQHDTDRILSSLNGDLNKNKQVATMAYLSSLIPYIYYGQEIGMKGELDEKNEHASREDFNDGYDIPRREPFKWKKDIQSPGMALWFENVEPYWNNRSIKSDDGTSVEEQDRNPNSLLNFYRKLLKFRSSNTTMTTGNFEVLKNANDLIFGYSRWNEKSANILVFNLEDESLSVLINMEDLPFDPSGNNWENVFSDGASEFRTSSEKIDIRLIENGFIVLELK